MKIKSTCVLVICLAVFNWFPVQAQFLIDGTIFENFGRFNYYGPYTEVSSTEGSIYQADFGSNFDHFETDPNSLRIFNPYNAHGPAGGSNDNFLGPSGLPGQQGVAGTVAPNFWNLVLKNGSTGVFSITNTAGANVYSNVEFSNGITTTVRSYREAGALRFQSGAGYSGGITDGQHVNGYVSKIGNQAFTFPVGSATDARPLTITNPTSSTSRIATAYETSNVENANSHSAAITAVYAQASWDWIVGSATDDDGLQITVSLPDVSGFANTNELRLVGWNGTSWTDLSHSATATGNVEGSSLSGLIPAGVTISQIGVGSALNSLPITLATFLVSKENGIASLDWTTTYETNSDYFEVQRSTDARSWKALGTVKSNGESQQTQFYNYKDQEPLNGVNYYRLKMIDHDGSFAFSDIKSAQFEFGLNIVFAPNPTVDKIYLLNKANTPLDRLQLFSASGKIVYDINQQDISRVDMLDLSNLSAGVYMVRVTDQKGEVSTHKVIRK